jgi:hypothetical protein
MGLLLGGGGFRKVVGFHKIRIYFISLVLIALLVALFVPSLPVISAPLVTIIPSSGAVGTTVTINGTVFDSYEGDNLHIFFDATEIENSPITVPSEGTFSVSFTIPANTPAGQHWIEVRSETTSILARNSFTVAARGIFLNPLEGCVGDVVNITGSGFYVDRAVTLYYTNLSIDQIGTEIASSTGEFSHQFTVPISTAGYHLITASNDLGNEAQTQFKVLPKLKLNVDIAGPGDLVNASGTGFAAYNAVTITFGSLGVTAVLTDALGSFDIDFYVPVIKPQTYDVRASDSLGHSSTTQFTIGAGASVSESSGASGSEISVSGVGFTPNHSITVYYDEIAVATALTDNNGDFTVTLTIPPGGGNHIITVSDGENTKEYGFTLETVPPPAPVLLLPINESMTKAEAHFEWQEVIDDSVPVTYNLEIASDINFATQILYKTGISSTEYTLTDNEILSVSFKNAPYFWRVQAVDGADNEGEYSESWIFYASVPSTPELLLPAADATVELPIRFSWQASTSLSPPITYILQIAATPGFVTPLLNISGLTVSEYLITEEDDLQLENMTYYWRVKAVDNALNAGDWSTIGSFSFIPPSGFPGWATCIMIAIAFIIAILLAFRTGRRTAYH